MTKDKALERLKQVDVDQYNKLVQDLEEGTKPLEVGLAEISPEASKTLADFEPKGLGLGLANESPETVKTVAEQFAELMAPVRGGDKDDDGDGGPAFPSIAPVTTEPPTVSDIENYLAKVAQEETTSTSTPTPSGGGDDDGPSLAEQMQKTMQEKAKEAAKTADQKTAEVQAKAQDRGATQAEQDKIVSEGAKVKEKLEQQAKGIKTGFKKGGLASRKK